MQVSQADIVAQTFGGLVNLPADPQTMVNSVNRAYIDRRGLKFSLSSKIWSPMLGLDQTSDNACIESLKNNRPLVVCNLTHMMALVGVSYLIQPGSGAKSIQQAWVADPALSKKVTEGPTGLAAGFRYLFPWEMVPSSRYMLNGRQGELTFIAEVSVA